MANLHKFFDDLNDELKIKFEHTYNIKYEDCETMLKESNASNILYYLSDDTDLLVYYFGLDALSGEPMTFLFFDELLDSPILPKLVSENPEFELADVTPIAKLDLTSISFDNWQKGLNCKMSYVKGNKFKDIDITYEKVEVSPKSKELDDFVNSLIPIFEAKQLQYPDTTIEQFICSLKFMYLIKEGKAFYIIHGVDKVEKSELFLLIAYVNDKGECYGPFILVTDSEVLRKKHCCYVVGHQEAVRLAYKLGCKSIDFGLYFSYKKSLNIPCTWLKGLSLKDKHLTYELAKVNPNYEGLVNELRRHNMDVVVY